MKLGVQYWHWLVLGMILIFAEIFVPSFTIFWFGLGAIAVAILMLIYADLRFSWQLLLWAVASSVFTFLWFRFIRPLMHDRTMVGISQEAAIGQTGQVIRTPASTSRGSVRFTTPLLGSEEWPFICDTTVGIGDRVSITDISSNTLVVKKL